MSPRPATAGVSLVELLVAMLLLELAAVTLLGVVLLTFRLERRVTTGNATDFGRLAEYADSAAAPNCAGAPEPEARELTFAATATRPPLTAAVRCGR